MDNTNIKDYFDNYIKPYLPYNDKKLFTPLIDYISTNYANDVYSNIPDILKKLYEDNHIVSDVYDQLLVSIGVDQNIINKLNTSEKNVFITSLSDFIRYKGSVSLFKKIGDSFDDSFDIYELFIDFDEELQKWIAKPYSIYKGNKYPSNIDILLYEDIYKQVPTLLISEEQLNILRKDKNAIFPIKTNLVLLDYNLYSVVNPMMNLVVSTFLKLYGDTPITLYMTDEFFTVSFKQLYYIWYYVICLYYNFDWTKFNIQELLIFSENNNPYNLFDLSEILNKYDSLDNINDIEIFYKEIFNDTFHTIFKSPGISVDSMRIVVNSFNKDFNTYLLNRINSVNEENKTREFSNITNEIFNSFSLFLYQFRNEPYFTEFYTNWFLPTLPHITIHPENTTSYIIMYNTKPFHVEFITRYHEAIVSDDKFNIILPSTEESFVMDLYKLDFISEMIDEFYYSLLLYKISIITLNSIVNINTIYKLDENKDYLVNLKYNYWLNPLYVDTGDITETKIIDNIINRKNSIDTISTKRITYNLNNIDNIEYYFNFKNIFKIINRYCSILDLCDNIKFNNINNNILLNDIADYPDLSIYQNGISKGLFEKLDYISKFLLHIYNINTLDISDNSNKNMIYNCNINNNLFYDYNSTFFLPSSNIMGLSDTFIISEE